MGVDFTLSISVCLFTCAFWWRVRSTRMWVLGVKDECLCPYLIIGVHLCIYVCVCLCMIASAQMCSTQKDQSHLEDSNFPRACQRLCKAVSGGGIPVAIVNTPLHTNP